MRCARDFKRSASCLLLRPHPQRHAPSTSRLRMGSGLLSRRRGPTPNAHAPSTSRLRMGSGLLSRRSGPHPQRSCSVDFATAHGLRAALTASGPHPQRSCSVDFATAHGLRAALTALGAPRRLARSRLATTCFGGKWELSARLTSSASNNHLVWRPPSDSASGQCPPLRQCSRASSTIVSRQLKMSCVRTYSSRL